jgi:hypothetical protein
LPEQFDGYHSIDIAVWLARVVTAANQQIAKFLDQAPFKVPEYLAPRA